MIAVGTLCYIGSAVSCAGCATLVGSIVTVTGGPHDGDVYTFQPTLICPQWNAQVTQARGRCLIPIAPPSPAVDLSQSKHAKRLRRMGAKA